jgi:serine/threonine-protein kinase
MTIAEPMTIGEPMLLPSDVELTPVEELPEEIRAQLTYRPGDHAITRPLARSASSIVDSNTARLLGAFRTPTRIVDAVLGLATERQLDPREMLERSYPVLRDLLASGFLVPADSAFAQPIQASVLAEGAIVGRFRVARTVQVMIDTQLCLARDPSGTNVALKIGRPGSDARRMFEHEAAILRALDGHVTPQVIEVGESEGRAYLAMTWIAGTDAETAAAGLRRLPPVDGRTPLLELGERIVAAYASLHGQGVLHGDVHPSNVLVGADGSVTLIDFGLAARPNDRSVPRGGVDFFMEPESAAAQANGAGASPLTAAGEQYGIGAVLYHLLTGGYTHSFSLEPDEMRRQLLEEPPLPFGRHDLHGLPSVEGVLLRTLSKDPRDRFDGTDEMLRAYRAAAREDLARPSGPGSSRAARHETSRREADRFVAGVLERLSPSGPLLTADLEAPRASVNLGAAGIAYGLLRMAMARDDERLLANADLWSIKALAGLGAKEAFVNEELEITPKDFGTTGLHHSATGVYVSEASIANARGDSLARAAAIEGILALGDDAGPELDVSFGRSGMLLGVAMLLDSIPERAGEQSGEHSSERPSERSSLVDLGNRLASGVWAELSAMGPLLSATTADARAGDRTATADGLGARPSASRAGNPELVRHLGAAHGWTGMLYAQLRWAAATGAVPPPVGARLDELARLAVPSGRGLRWPREVGSPDDGALASTWCNGAAGMVALWNLAARLLGEDRFLRLAEGAAWTAYEGHPAPGDLCCGLAGRAYALLTLHRTGADPIWLARARDLAEQAAAQVGEHALRRDSLYKGEVGVATLLVDLERPDGAAMPFYDREPWT